MWFETEHLKSTLTSMWTEWVVTGNYARTVLGTTDRVAPPGKLFHKINKKEFEEKSSVYITLYITLHLQLCY